ncbi:precorrin-2 dehydrogenase/sirohydrochlorin ferrochelatase family protein [Calderihabitans maritimus]|uniref:precorrin-2 dehydrogenase n=1 Tax=Calderihabitans maritimus TaxID=1246530 RepID=A0A1Z5HWF1_9FIRM|nr:bifunctional precorrin-2 dehydrogenase/sirohydrochlorin ferrochelatase [Calderihabitans maritimus]GAW93600.1 siroheme synthase [Calderihabitans maritimus]
MTSYYPVFFDLSRRPCLVVGGGKVAERKVRDLLRAGAAVTVISPQLTGGLEELARRGAIQYLARPYQAGDVEGYFLVVSATGDKSVNEQVARECHARDIPVNVVDAPALCTFIVPAVLRRGSLAIAVSTGGKSPYLAGKIKKKLEEEFGPEYAELTDLLGEVRDEVLKACQDPLKRKEVFRCLVESDLLELIKQGNKKMIRERISRCLSLR